MKYDMCTTSLGHANEFVQIKLRKYVICHFNI